MRQIHGQKQWLNCPAMPPPPKEPAMKYFISTLKEIMVKCQNVPELAYKMMIKVAHMLLAVFSSYAWIHLTPLQINCPQVFYKLSQYPSTNQVLNIYARVIHFPSCYQMTYKEASFNCFFEYPGSPFSPYEQFINTRFYRYKQHSNRSFTLSRDIH